MTPPCIHLWPTWKQARWNLFSSQSCVGHVCVMALPGIVERNPTPLCFPPTVETVCDLGGTGDPMCIWYPVLWKPNSLRNLAIPGDVKCVSETAQIEGPGFGKDTTIWLFPKRPVGLMHPICRTCGTGVLGPGLTASPMRHTHVKNPYHPQDGMIYTPFADWRMA